MLQRVSAQAHTESSS